VFHKAKIKAMNSRTGCAEKGAKAASSFRPPPNLPLCSCELERGLKRRQYTSPGHSRYRILEGLREVHLLMMMPTQAEEGWNHELNHTLVPMRMSVFFVSQNKKEAA
jgi:hypothetical protein